MPQCNICFKCFTHDGNLQAHIRSVNVLFFEIKFYASRSCAIRCFSRYIMEIKEDELPCATLARFVSRACAASARTTSIRTRTPTCGPSSAHCVPMQRVTLKYNMSALMNWIQRIPNLQPVKWLCADTILGNMSASENGTTGAPTASPPLWNRPVTRAICSVFTESIIV